MSYKIFKTLSRIIGIAILLSYILLLCLNWNGLYLNNGQKYYLYDTDYESFVQSIDSFCCMKERSRFAIVYDEYESVSKYIYREKHKHISNHIKNHFSEYIGELDGIIDFVIVKYDSTIEVTLESFIPSRLKPIHGYDSSNIMFVNDCHFTPFKYNFWVIKYFENKILRPFSHNFKKDYWEGYVCNYYLSIFLKYQAGIWLIFGIVLLLRIFSTGFLNRKSFSNPLTDIQEKKNTIHKGPFCLMSHTHILITIICILVPIALHQFYFNSEAISKFYYWTGSIAESKLRGAYLWELIPSKDTIQWNGMDIALGECYVEHELIWEGGSNVAINKKKKKERISIDAIAGHPMYKQEGTFAILELYKNSQTKHIIDIKKITEKDTLCIVFYENKNPIDSVFMYPYDE